MQKGFFTYPPQMQNLVVPPLAGVIGGAVGKATPPFAAPACPAAATPGGPSRAKSLSPSVRPHAALLKVREVWK